MKSPYVDKLDPWSSHVVIYRWLRDFPPGTRILDVGTASGTLGKLCQVNQFHLVGIEPVLAYAVEAKPYYTSFFVGSLDEAPVEMLSSYQVIILADVLEHMPDPQAALARLVAAQNPGAVFVVSVPNIANIWIRFNLLLGRFEYQERGILDRTHLRFYTKASFVRMCSEAGLQFDRLIATPIPLNLVHPFFAETQIGKLALQGLAKLTQVLPTLLGYQFVVLARKGGG